MKYKTKYFIWFFISLVITETLVFLLYLFNTIQMKDFWTESYVPVLSSFAQGFIVMIAVAVSYTFAWAFLTVFKEIFIKKD